MLSVRCLSVLSVCLSVCDVGVLWPNVWTDQDETWHAGRPRPWPHCVRWGPTSPTLTGHSPPIFSPYLLRPNGCMDQDATRHGDRPRPRPLCIRQVSIYRRKRHSSPPLFGPCLLWPRSPISATVELLFDHATYRSRQKQDKTLRHLGRDSSALRSELSLGHFGTSADLSGQFGPTKLVPKCPGCKVSWVRSVCNSSASMLT